jgi:hypothetical protein
VLRDEVPAPPDQSSPAEQCHDQGEAERLRLRERSVTTGQGVDHEEAKEGKPTDAGCDFERANTGRAKNLAEFVLKFTVAKWPYAKTTETRQESCGLHAGCGESRGAPTYVSALFGQIELLNVSFSPGRPYTIHPDRQEHLPFTVRVVTTAQDLAKAVEVRASAYARHLPTLGQSLLVPEAEDLKSDVLVLLAERKFDARPIGSLRLQSNVERPLRLQGEAPMLDVYSSRRLVESTRLGVDSGGTSKLVTAALIKTAYEICYAAGVEYNVTGGRRSMAQVFRSLQFDELDGGPFPISFGNNIPHWIFVLPIRAFEGRLQSANHWYYEFMARTEHPDIEIDWSYVLSVLKYR